MSDLAGTEIVDALAVDATSRISAARRVLEGESCPTFDAPFVPLAKRLGFLAQLARREWFDSGDRDYFIAALADAAERIAREADE